MIEEPSSETSGEEGDEVALAEQALAFSQEKIQVHDVFTSNLYMGYQYLAHMGGVLARYAKATMEKSEILSVSSMADSLHTDLGHVYELWQLVGDEMNYGMPVYEDRELTELIKGRLHRAEQVSGVIHDWMECFRYARILIRMEMRWQQFVYGLKNQLEGEDELIDEMLENNEWRIRQLDGLQKNQQERLQKLTMQRLIPTKR